MSNPLSIGIDGCKGGWLAVSMTSLKIQRITLLENISKTNSIFSKADQIWIDMPIGLSEGNSHRDLEAHVRPLLRPNRTSSVFTPPCREAVYQADYQSAKETNFKQCGKRISIQSWNITPKIRELDSWLLEDISRQEHIFEAHPELCFAALNGGKPLATRKQNPEGIEQRLTLLSTYQPEVKTAFQQALTQFPGKSVKKDDLLDAICLALSAQLSIHHGKKTIQGKILQDPRGLFIRMVYPNIP